MFTLVIYRPNVKSSFEPRSGPRNLLKSYCSRDLTVTLIHYTVENHSLDDTQTVLIFSLANNIFIRSYANNTAPQFRNVIKNGFIKAKIIDETIDEIEKLNDICFQLHDLYCSHRRCKE